MPRAKSTSGPVGDQIHVCARARNFAADSLEQDGEDDVASTSALMRRNPGHVNHVAVPASIAE